MDEKPKIALYWCSSCGGCEESVIDLAEDLLALSKAADIAFWPVALDSRTDSIDDLPDGALAVTLINGAVRLDDHVRMARLLRQKSALVVAHGSCAHMGGVIGLANLISSHELLSRSYRDVPTIGSPCGDMPGRKPDPTGHEPALTALQDRVYALDQIIEVDYYIPGCPPTPEILANALQLLLNGALPPQGSVLADKKALCHSCPRLASKPETIRLRRFYRLYEKMWDPAICFLDQGLYCAGPATRGGCRARCITANMPCRGCFGPLDGIADPGARGLSLLASVMDAADEAEAIRLAESLPDPAGLFYRYGLAAAMLKTGFGKTDHD